MKRSIIAFCALLGVSASGQQPAAPQEIPFESVPNFFKLPPGVNFGEGAGIAVNSRGHIFVYSRTGGPGYILSPRSAQLFEFNPDGTFVREPAKDLYSMAWAHAVRIDSQDNIWLVDNGSDLAVKLNPEGKVMMVYRSATGSAGRDAPDAASHV